MNSTLSLESENRIGERGYSIFLYFLFSISLSQLFIDFSKPLSAFFLLISSLLIVALVFGASRISLLFFMFFAVLMNIVIPLTSDKTFSQILPFLFLPVILAKSGAKIRHVRMNLIGLCLFVYFTILLVTVFYGMKLPFAFLGAMPGNTGLLARWNLLNTFFVFVATLFSFEVESLPRLLEKFYKLFLVILVISLIIFYSNVTFKLPLFNTFSWSVLYEGSGSKRMGIAGLAAIYVFIYFLCFKTNKQTAWITFLLIVVGVIASGGRSAMLTFFLIAYLSWVIKNKILLRTFVISCVAVFVFIVFSLSPLILYIPQKVQRLFVIFPREFYSGSLKEFEGSAAANSSTFRYTMWKMAFPEIKKHIVLGKGFGVPEQNYSFASEGLLSLQKKSTETLYHDFMAGGQLHNTFVSIAFIMGLPAMLLFLYAFSALIFKTYRYYVAYPFEYGPYLKFLLLLLFSSLLSAMLGDLHFDLVFFIFFAITVKTLNHLHSRRMHEPEKKLE